MGETEARRANENDKVEIEKKIIRGGGGDVEEISNFHQITREEGGREGQNYK